jgi:hypothetical protein
VKRSIAPEPVTSTHQLQQDWHLGSRLHQASDLPLRIWFPFFDGSQQFILGSRLNNIKLNTWIGAFFLRSYQGMQASGFRQFKSFLFWELCT